MAHSKKTLQSYLMTLRAYRSVVRHVGGPGSRLIYEVCCMDRDPKTQSLQKRVYFVPGHSILPDDRGFVESCWIHLLSPEEISSYEEKCRKYGI